MGRAEHLRVGLTQFQAVFLAKSAIPISTMTRIAISRRSLFLLLSLLCLQSLPAQGQAIPNWTSLFPHKKPPPGWIFKSGNINEYDFGLDTVVVHRGKASAYLRSSVTSPIPFGNLTQRFRADAFKGKRIRLAAFIKTEDVTIFAGLWMRVDGEEGQTLSFDNMHDRPIAGTTDWQEYEVVLDVPEESAVINIGMLLYTKGRAWLDTVSITEISHEISVTSMVVPDTPNPQRGARNAQVTQARSTNLDFEEKED